MIFIDNTVLLEDSILVMKPYTSEIMNHPFNVRTLTESGSLYQINLLREQKAAKRQRRQKAVAAAKGLLFHGSFTSACKNFIGKQLAKMVYTLWQSGFFSVFEEFDLPTRSGNEHRQNSARSSRHGHGHGNFA